MMNFYRIKQFYWALNSKIDKIDIEFINSILNDKELQLFNMLSTHEKKHSIKVAYDVQKICKDKKVDSMLLLKAALLHDIGKVFAKLSLLDKSIMVLAHNISKGKIKKFSQYKKINVYYNHGKLGSELLKDKGCNKQLLYLIENHDNHKINNNIELEILRICDNRN